MDEFVDMLFTQERVCDTTLPRLTRREVLEDDGILGPRTSPLQHLLHVDDEDEFEGTDEAESDNSAQSDQDDPEDDVIVPLGNGKLRFKSGKNKVQKFKRVDKDVNSQAGGGARESLSITDTNRIRVGLGLDPLIE
jgi:hypothetical protein